MHQEKLQEWDWTRQRQNTWIDSQPDEYTTIKINGSVLEKVDSFKYLESIKSSDGTCRKDVMARIAMAKQKMNQLNNIWKDRSVPNSLKITILKC